MHTARRTQLLALLLIATAIASLVCWNLLVTQHANTITSGRDLQICRAELASIESSTLDTDRSDSANGGEMAINRQLRAAAISSHLSDQLASIEPGTPTQVGESDYNATPIYVRLNAVSLMQLIGFLYELSFTDHALSTSDIELSLPTTPTAGQPNSTETWTADLTLRYLQYAQHQPQSR